MFVNIHCLEKIIFEMACFYVRLAFALVASSRKVQQLRVRVQQITTMQRFGVTGQNLSQKKWKNVKIFLSENVRDYCENTSVHGLKYIVNKRLYPIERLFFAISLICVVFGTIFFVVKIYAKWNSTPMLVSINPKYSQITHEPFPAVTICNLNQAYRQKAEEFSIYSFDHTMIQMLCMQDVNITIADAIMDWSNLKNFIFEISQPCSNMLLNCKYGDKQFNCTEIFRPIVTDNGLCCTFNLIDPKFMYREEVNKHLFINKYNYPQGYEPVDWSSEAGYQADLPEKFIPMKSLGVGESLGLSLVLDVESDEYYCSSSDSVGFKILLHNPLEVPNMREIGLLLSAGRETKVRIRSETIESEKYVRYISKSSRNCYFEDEMYLSLYNEYTQSNCLVECSAGELLDNCGCLPYFKPMLHGNETICDVRDSTCVERVRVRTMFIDKAGRGCATKCMPSCNDHSYSPTFVSAPLIHSGFQIENQVVKNISSDYVAKNIAVVKFYFKNNAYTSKKNVDFIDVTDFLSNIGGIVGVFFGFSFISLAELIFYAILRPVRVLITSKKSGFAKSAKLRKFNSVRALSRKQKIGYLQQTNINTHKNLPKIRNDWAVVAGKQSMTGNDIKDSKIAWQPGMDYTP